MHILHLIKTSEGAAWAINLIKELQINYPGLSFSVVVPDGGKHFKEYQKVCRNVYVFDFKLNRNIYSSGLQLRKIVASDDPDIIHSWFTQTTLYVRMFLRDFKKPRLFQVVGPLHLENRLFKFFDIKSAQKNDYWIATSQYIFDKYLNAGVATNQLFLNYAYIDLGGLLQNKNQQAAVNIREQYNIAVNNKIIGTASYIYPPKFYQKSGIKGHDLMLRIFKKMLSERNDIYLIIAGTTFGTNKTYENKLKKIAASINKERIIFTGKYDNAYSVLSSFDVFVYLSKSENLGGVFESLLFEIPTVSSDRGGLPELVIDNETGYCCSLHDQDKIKLRITQILDDPDAQSAFKEKGKQKVLKTFDKQRIIEQAYSIYLKVYKSNNVQEAK